MMDDEFKYVVDENGDRILVGLTQSETLEFERLDALRRDHSTELSFVTMEGALQPPRGKKVAGAFRKARAGPLGIDRSNKGNKALKCSNRGLPPETVARSIATRYVEQVLRLLTNRLAKDLKAGIWPHQAQRLAVLKTDRPYSPDQ
jgi:hypothetical protein